MEAEMLFDSPKKTTLVFRTHVNKITLKKIIKSEKRENFQTLRKKTKLDKKK